MNHNIYPTPFANSTVCHFSQSEVIKTGAYLPKQSLSSVDLMQEIQTERKYGLPHDWMTKDMGILSRRISRPDQMPSELACHAARQCLDGLSKAEIDEIDAVIFCGIERDRPEPSTAHTIQNSLGLKANHVFDVANACFGFFEGVKLASALIASHAIRSALVTTGEISTRVALKVADMLKNGMRPEQAKHLWGMLSVGDAGGAMLLAPPSNPHRGFVDFRQRSASQYAQLCHYSWSQKGDLEAHMNMAQIVGRGLKLNKEVYQESIDRLGWHSFDWMIAHQTGKTSHQHAERLSDSKDGRVIKTFPKLGNITTATLPVSFKKLLASDSLNRGDKIGGLFAGSGLVAGQFAYQF